MSPCHDPCDQRVTRLTRAKRLPPASFTHRAGKRGPRPPWRCALREEDIHPRARNLTFPDVTGRLRQAVREPLPGVTAQLRLAPRPRPGWHAGAIPPVLRQAAGILLLFPKEGLVHLLLTVRAASLAHHSGQVSLPGGAVDSDETPEQAAVREAAEEVGIDPAAVEVLGRLTPLHIPVSGFVLHPIVGICEDRPGIRPSAWEVERVLEVPLEWLVDPGRLSREVGDVPGGTIEIPYFDLGTDRLWGATAMVVAELLWLLGHRPDPWRDVPLENPAGAPIDH
jgi:8-oxo-dGTP pyrophosphatase MutT (NUDIX family)